MPNPLEKELETFRKVLPTLLDRKGQYVLIRGDEVAGVWPTWQEAAREGYNRYGLEPFLVKQITDDERPRYFSRSLEPCPS